MKQQLQNKYQLSLIDLHDRIMLQTELGDHCDKIQQSSVGAQRYCQLIYTNIILIKTKLYKDYKTDNVFVAFLFSIISHHFSISNSTCYTQQIDGLPSSAVVWASLNCDV